MKTKQTFLLAALITFSGLHSSSAENASVYEGLTLDTLPPVNKVVEAALDHLPKSVGTPIDWDRRIRLSALLPTFQLRFRTFQATKRNFSWVDQTIRRSERTDTDSDTLNSRVSANFSSSFVEEESLTEDLSKRISETKGPFALATDDTLTWRDDYTLTATWNLSELIFHNDELEAAQVGRFVADFRFDYIQDVADIYQKLKQSLRAIKRDPKSASNKDKRDIFAVLLDTITGGFISYQASGIEEQSFLTDTKDAKRTAFNPNGSHREINSKKKTARDKRDDDSPRFQGLVSSVDTAPGTLADFQREDEEAQEEAEEEELEDLNDSF